MSDPSTAVTASCTRPRSSAATSTSATRSSFASATRSGGRSAHTRMRWTRCFGTSSSSASPGLRALGRDDRGRQVLSFVEGEPALPPGPAVTVLPSAGALLREMHDAQAGFVPPRAVARRAARPRRGGGRRDLPQRHLPAERDLPRGASGGADRLGPGDPRAAPLRRRVGGQLLGAARARRASDRVRASAGTEGRAAALLCDGYGLEPSDRIALLDVVAHRNRMGYEIHRVYGGERRLPGWREMWDAGSGDEILKRSAWFEAHRADLQRSLA